MKSFLFITLIMTMACCSVFAQNEKEGKATKHKYSFQDEFTTVKFLYVDIDGNIAVSKFEFYEGETLKYIDFLSLIRFEDGWKIVSKISHPVPGE